MKLPDWKPAWVRLVSNARRLPLDMVVTAVVVLACLGVARCEHEKANSAQKRAARYASEALLQKAAAEGWQVQATDAKAKAGSLAKQLAKADSQLANLATAMRQAGAQPVAHTVIHAAAQGTIVVQPPAQATQTDTTVKDGPLTAHILAVPAADVRLDWHVNVPIDLVHAALADRRFAVFARSTDPRVSVTVDTLLMELPKPQGGGWLKPLGIGAAAGALGCLFLCR